MGQGSGSAKLALMLGTVAVLLSSCPGVSATTFVVGGNGWQIPTSLDYYELWASQYSYTVGDVLQFNYDPQQHNVQPMPVDGCNKTDATKPPFTDGATLIPLATNGTKRYICTVDTHCNLGVKLTIEVSDSATSIPVTAPAPTPSGAYDTPRSAGLIGTASALVIAAAPLFLY